MFEGSRFADDVFVYTTSYYYVVVQDLACAAQVTRNILGDDAVELGYIFHIKKT